MAFYKLVDGRIQVAPNFVAAPGYTLEAADKDTYEYPVDGWYWFNADAEAAAHFGVAVGVESSLELNENWGNFISGLPVDMAATIGANTPLMLRLVRLEVGVPFEGANDKLFAYWGMIDKSNVDAECVSMLNALAAACNLPVRIDGQGEMILA
jgi:hypothetical protein